jgi:hypothetical protein
VLRVSLFEQFSAGSTPIKQNPSKHKVSHGFLFAPSLLLSFLTLYLKSMQLCFVCHRHDSSGLSPPFDSHFPHLSFIQIILSHVSGSHGFIHTLSPIFFLGCPRFLLSAGLISTFSDHLSSCIRRTCSYHANCLSFSFLQFFLQFIFQILYIAILITTEPSAEID